MRTVTVHELKKTLATCIDQAAAGERILITRHGRAVASLVAPDREHVHAGAVAGHGGLEPGERVRGCEDYLEVLQDDRGGGPGR